MNAICIKSYEINNIRFDKGYVEKIQKGEQFSPNGHWMYATDKETFDFYNTPTYKRPKGRYLV
jgi:hypothetical protein